MKVVAGRDATATMAGGNDDDDVERNRYNLNNCLYCVYFVLCEKIVQSVSVFVFFFLLLVIVLISSPDSE